jgi:hypothetical protein
MLIYHPAFDAYHCLVRFCTILEDSNTVQFDRLRILDFCLCFPASVADFKLPRNLLSLRSHARQIDNPYRVPIGAKRVFADLEMIHRASLGCLAAAEIVEMAPHSESVQRSSAPLPEDLMARCHRLRKEEVFFFEKFLPPALGMQISGDEGLKARSGLAEYRYDAA